MSGGTTVSDLVDAYPETAIFAAKSITCGSGPFH